MAFLLFTVALIFLLLAIHPFITYPLSLYVFRIFQRQPQVEIRQDNNSYAVCVCAYNEEANITEKAENLIALKKIFPGLEIHVYVDAASDRTAEILDKYRSEINVHVSPERHGKTYGMNLLLSKTQASIIIFTDANVIMDVDTLHNLPRYFADPQVGCVCGHLKYVNAGETITAQTGSLYWRLEEWIKTLENDTGSVMGADGSIFAIRRTLHHAPPDNIIDDMFVSFSILCDGYRVVRAQDVVAYEKSASSASEEYRRKIRIACQAFNVHRLLWPRLRDLGTLNLYKYISHKWLRWLTIYWLAATIVCFELGMIASGTGITGLILILIGLGVLYAGFAKPLPLISQLADIVGAFLATGLGVLRSLKGEDFKTWAPAISARSS